MPTRRVEAARPKPPGFKALEVRAGRPAGSENGMRRVTSWRMPVMRSGDAGSEDLTRCSGGPRAGPGRGGRAERKDYAVRRTVIVLGGGIGGLAAARHLRARLGSEHRVVLVDRHGSHVFSPSLPWFLIGARREAQFTMGLGALARRGIEVVVGEVVAVDAARLRVRVAGSRAKPAALPEAQPADGASAARPPAADPVQERTLEGDYLVIALGADLAHRQVAGWKPAVINFYCARGARAAREAVATFAGGTLALVIAATPFKCPAAPYEMAMLLADHFRRRRMRDRVDLHLYTPEPHPLPVAGPAVGDAVRGLLAQHGIACHTGRRLERVEGEARTLVFADGGRARFDLALGVPPHRPAKVVEDAGLVDGNGWVPVDRHSLRAAAERVFVIGDLAGIPIADGRMLPKAGVFAHRQATVVARNIADEIAGRGPRGRFDGVGDCFIETGGGRAAFARGDFYAEPAPVLEMRGPGQLWHWAKVMVERRWMAGWV